MRCCPLRGRSHEAGQFPNFPLIIGISKMKLIQSVVASAALLAGLAASSANAYVAFLRTDLTPYAKLESYPSLGELASNSNGAIASNITPSIPVTQSMFTDGTYFYKIAANAQGDAGTYNNLFIRYQSLSDLCKDVNGETFLMNGYGMYYDAAANGAIVVEIASARRATARSPLTEYCRKICAGNQAVAIDVSRAARVGAFHDGVDPEFPNQHVFINGAVARCESE